MLGFRLRRQEYRRTLEHLETAFGNEQTPVQRRALADRVFRHLGTTFAEFCALPRMSPAEIRASVHAEGLEHLEQSLARGRGVVLVTAHMGNWEYAGAYLAAYGFNSYVVARRIYFEPFNEQIEKIRGTDLSQSPPPNLPTSSLTKNQIHCHNILGSLELTG